MSSRSSGQIDLVDERDVVGVVLPIGVSVLVFIVAVSAAAFVAALRAVAS